MICLIGSFLLPVLFFLIHFVGIYNLLYKRMSHNIKACQMTDTDFFDVFNNRQCDLESGSCLKRKVLL